MLGINTALISQVSFAQATQENERALEKITVTAHKRTQSIQEVPISIVTLNGQQFENIVAGG